MMLLLKTISIGLFLQTKIENAPYFSYQLVQLFFHSDRFKPHTDYLQNPKIHIFVQHVSFVLYLIKKFSPVILLIVE